MEPLFTPSANTQRHQFVRDFVKINKPKKVVDLGCNDCSLLKTLKFHREIELLCGVDIDSKVMKHELDPGPTEYLQPGNTPLSIELYHGSVTHKDARLRGFDLVTSIELIEHLYPEDVELFTGVLFGYMTPGTVIVSTPNVEFNPLFPRKPGFRNPDHKFEWTRAEFQSWALKACGQYGYEAEFTGVGQAPPHLHVRVGFCTQIAVFKRLAGQGSARAFIDDDGEIFSYKLLYTVSYPSLSDNNILRGCLVSEVLYWAHRLSRRRLEYRVQGYQAGEMEESDAEGDTGPTEEYEECVFDGEEEMHGLEDVKMTSRGQLESYRQGRRVCVPLRSVWSCCRRIRELSGSLARLRLFIADDPLISWSQSGLAVVLDEGQQEREDEDGSVMEASCVQTVEDEDLWDSL